MKKNPILAAVLSILPGLGQLYNKRYIKAGVLFILFVSFISVFYQFLATGIWGIVTLGETPREDDSRTLLAQGIIASLVIIIALIFYFVNIRDAYNDAKLINSGDFRTMFQRFRDTWDKTFPYAIIAPGLFLLIFIVVFPLLYMFFLAFTNYNLYNSPPANLLDYVGFDNFRNLLEVDIWRNTFFSVFTWTIIWTLVATTLQIALALLLAIVVNNPLIRFKRLIRTILILPWAVPAFVTILIFAAMFNDQFGAINAQIIQPIFGTNIAWLSDPFWTRFALIMIQTWLGFPFVFALFTGVLQSVSSDWYEAADMDGASSWQKFTQITFPHIMFATAPLLIMQYAGNFNNFNIIYLFNNGGPAVRGQNAGGSDILISWVYKLTFETNNYNMAAAISLIIGAIVAIVAAFQFSRTKAVREEGER